MREERLLEVEDLTIYYITDDAGTCKAVNHMSFSLGKGETLGLVGETGAGKTTIARGIMGLIPNPPGKIAGGRILFRGQDLLKIKEKEIRKIRGNDISMIFQDPMTALNPTDTVGEQIAEVLKYQKKLGKKEARQEAVKMMEMVGIPGERYEEYPHQFSGGMKQRVVIAIALSCNPELLLADEPTTALDVTIQAQVLDLIVKLKKEKQTSMILITHDLGIVAEVCDKVAIMYAGEIVEYGSLEQIYNHTCHPYTKGLFGSIPDLDSHVKRLSPIPGLMPDPAALPKGCSFCPRCTCAGNRCEGENPEMTEVETGHFVKCFQIRKEREDV